LTALLFKVARNQFKHTPVITKNATFDLVPNYHAMKVYRGNGGNAPHLLNIGTRFK
jgi:hypothetical protein